MAQLTIYLPERIEKQLRVAARRSRKSLSAYVVELIEARDGGGKDNGWPAEFVKLLEGGGSFPDDIQDEPPAPVPSFDE